LEGIAMKNFSKWNLVLGLSILMFGSLCFAVYHTQSLQAENIEVKIPNSEETLALKAKIPAGWARNPDFGGIVYQPDNYADYFYPPILSYTTGCAGSCAPNDIPKNIEKLIKGIKDTLARPNINTGDPELDAIRANVKIIAEEKFSDDGWLLAAAVSYPEELSSAMYTPKIVVNTFRHHKGDRFFVQTTARAQLSQKDEFLSVFLEVCKQTDY
jgi:hypothetical protein